MQHFDILGLTRLILFVIARSRYPGRRGNPDTGA